MILTSNYKSAYIRTIYFSGFLRRRLDKNYDSDPVGKWSVVSPPHARQRDGQSCGVYVLKVISGVNWHKEKYNNKRN